jgi:uncharacterized protein
MRLTGPVKPQSRLEFVDILRGFALIGVLTANLTSFSGYSTDPVDYADFLDKAILIGIQFLVRAKFYSLFSFLFGWGMSVQMLRADDRGQRFVPVFARRMAILLIFGLIHGMLIWSGDILTLYAILGFALLLFRKRSERTLLIAAVLLLLLTIILNLPGEAMDAFRNWYAGITAFMRQGNLPDAILATGTYWEIVPKTTQDFWAAQSWFIYYVGGVFSMFLLGLYVGKRQILQNVDDHLPLLKRTLLIGLIIGVIFNSIYVWNTLHPQWIDPRYSRFVGVGSRTIGAPALMLFYVCGLTLLTRKDLWLERLRPLGNLGRMALSNYLLQSLICVFIFYGFGLGLYGQIDPSFGLIITVLVIAAQIRYSRWHLYRYQFGPMEWLWRTLTYGRRQKWRVASGRRLVTRDEGQVASDEGRVGGGLRRIHPLVGLGIVWVILAVWAVGLLMWYRDLGDGSTVSFQLAVQPTATPAPTQAAGQPGPENEPQLVITPQVEEVTYRPGPIARSGDMDALAQSFDANQAFEQIELLSSEPHDGRRAGSAGGLAAGDYLADRFNALGLQPAGEDGTFFQSFPISYTNLATAPQFILTKRDGVIDDSYRLHEDYAPIIRDFVGDGSGSGAVLWMNRCTHDDFGLLNAQDKIALCQLDPDRATFIEASRSAVEHGAAGLLLVTDPAQRPADMGDRYTEAWIPDPIPALRVYPRLVDDLFLGSGSTISESLLLDEPLPLSAKVDLTVEILGRDVCPPVTPDRGCKGRNVLAVLPGRDPEFADELLIIGAHYDHLGDSPSDGPARTVWPGANDDASGTAVLLEIARNWQEEGYVPRRTVLFAAWDAEELGLLGSIYYVQHPQYPPQNVVGMLQLDMVGAGGDILNGAGSDELLAIVNRAAEDMDIPLQQIRLGRSDHVPFINAGIPAAVLIWLDEDGNTPDHYHRPSDNPDVIDLQKLEEVGELAATIVLNLVESEPAILALLQERETAVSDDDLAGFLDTSVVPNTSSAQQVDVDSAWFADLQAHDPLTVTISTTDLIVSGDTATADTTIRVTYPISETVQSTSGSLLAQFTRLEDGWRWDGPHLEEIRADGVTINYPANLEDDLTDLPAAVRGQYANIAGALGLPVDTPFTIQLFPDAQALRSSTALFLPEEQQCWVGSGLVRMVYTAGITETAATCRTDSPACPTNELVQLVLANRGIHEAGAPWLWHGLPLAWQAQAEPIRVQSEQLPRLHEALRQGLPIPATTAAWATTDYALRQAGWDGLLDWRQTDAWQDDWQRHLTAVQSDLDRLLAQRTAAILAQDEAAFLETAVPGLAVAQRRWMADLDAYPLLEFAQTGVPLALLEDGSVLAQVTMNYELRDRGPSTAEMPILFTAHEEGYLWAGKRLLDLQGDTAVVRYPDGFEEQAVMLHEKVTVWTPQLAAMLDISPTLPLEIELYDGPDDMRAAIALPYPATNWTEPGQAIKLQTSAGDGELVTQLVRQLLYQAGVTEEWLLRGIPAFVSIRFDGGATQQELAARWPELQTAAVEVRLIDLAAISPRLEMPQADDRLAEMEAWDAVRYAVHAHGWQALAERVASGPLASPGQTGWRMTLGDFQQEWADSLARGHIQPEWIEMVSAFDVDAVMADVDMLASEELEGRLAGTAGDKTAATNIATAFRSAGLQPAGENGTYFQTVPITVSSSIPPIYLELVTPSAETVSFAYRDEFLPVHPTVGGEPLSGQLFFVQKDAAYEGLDFAGGIVVLPPTLSAAEDLRRALDHGAGGLILIGFKREDEDLYGKMPDSLLETAEIPVLELTQGGYTKLLTTLELDRDKLKQFEPVQALNAKAQIHFTMTPSQPATTSNVLAVLPGSDPLLREETIIVGAHYDYVGDDGDGNHAYGGANEATGVATMMAIARLWQEIGYKPQRTILFAAWGGQELGNVGSQFYVTEPARPLTDTIGLIQIEGVGGGKGIALGAQGDEERDGWLLSGMDTAVSQLGGKVVLTPYATNSDHASFAAQGFPTLFISWRLAGNDNLSTGTGYNVEAKNVQFAGQSAALLLMSLAQ